jgi:transposase
MPKTVSHKHERYTNDFKRLAVALTLHPDTITIDIAEHLGIHPVMLYRWRMEMRRGDLPPKYHIDDTESETDIIKANRRIKELEKKLKEAERERDFLKKAKRFFQERR